MHNHEGLQYGQNHMYATDLANRNIHRYGNNNTRNSVYNNTYKDSTHDDTLNNNILPTFKQERGSLSPDGQFSGRARNTNNHYGYRNNNRGINRQTYPNDSTNLTSSKAINNDSKSKY